MKLLLSIVLICIALSVPVKSIALGLSSAQPSQPSQSTGRTLPATPSSDINVPLCYIQISGTTQLTDLTHICGGKQQDAPRLQVSYPKPPTPYDQAAIKNFDDSVYGEGN